MTWQSAFLLLSVVSAQEIPIGDSVIPHTKLKEGRKECEGRKDRGKDRKIVKKGHPISALPMEDRKDCEGGREGRKHIFSIPKLTNRTPSLPSFHFLPISPPIFLGT
jgi:hypothetical protein